MRMLSTYRSNPLRWTLEVFLRHPHCSCCSDCWCWANWTSPTAGRKWDYLRRTGSSGWPDCCYFDYCEPPKESADGSKLCPNASLAEAELPLLEEEPNLVAVSRRPDPLSRVLAAEEEEEKAAVRVPAEEEKVWNRVNPAELEVDSASSQSVRITAPFCSLPAQVSLFAPPCSCLLPSAGSLVNSVPANR